MLGNVLPRIAFAPRRHGARMIHQHGRMHGFLSCFSRFDVEGYVPAVPGFACQYAGLPSLKLNIYRGVRRHLSGKNAIL